MGKDKKKKEKKRATAAVHKPVRESAVSLHSLTTAGNQAEDQQASSGAQEEPKPCKEPPPLEPVEYEEPILTRLIVESYEGEKVHGLYEGEGLAKFQGGNVYQGMFSEGLMHGQGTYTWANGVKYEGNFVKNMQMHHGRYTWPNGDVYEGDVKNGIRHGFGMYKFGNCPVSYVGQWFEGKRHGKGTIYYNKEGSSWHEGNFVNNVKSGWGIRCYKSGNVYEGQWERGVCHGEGRMRWLTTDQEYEGQWVNGIQHGHGTYIWYLKRIRGSQYPLRNTYVGEFVNGERHGRGKFIYASGATYEGDWVFNKKHGRGKVVFKNGRVYEGKFINDRIAEFPAFQLDNMCAHNLSGICAPHPFRTESIKVLNGPGSLPVLGSAIEIDISTLLATFPEKDKEEEIKQTEFAVLRHISVLRKIYTFYSSLGDDSNLDNTFLMTKLQFWRFLKDCRFHHCGVTLADMDRILNGRGCLEEIHSPYETLLLRKFLTCLIYLSFHIYDKEFRAKSPRLFKCFSKMMSKNILPHACQVKGVLYSNRQETVHAFNFTNKCWEIYEAFCRPSSLAPYEPTMKMRHFVWMLKDLRLVSKQLTATKIVDILAKGSPYVRDGEDINLEKELVFLEFFEALLDCALVYVSDEILKLEAEWVSQLGSSSWSSDLSKGAQVSPPMLELSPHQSFRTRSTSSVEASSETRDTAPCQDSVKTSGSKFVHCADTSKTKTKGKAKDGEKEGKTSRRGSRSFQRERSGSVQGSHTGTTVNVTFISDVMPPVDKEERGAQTPQVLEEEHSSPVSTPLKELAEKLEKAKDDKKAQLTLWISRVYIFFVRKLFVNYRHLHIVKETILDNRAREAELAEQRRIQEEEEEARLQALREAEEARKLEEAAAEKAMSELEESTSRVQLQSPPKEESPIVPQIPPSSKAVTAWKKK